MASVIDCLDGEAALSTLITDATAATVLTELGISAFLQTVLNDATAADALTTLGLSAFFQTLVASADLTTLLEGLGRTAASIAADSNTALHFGKFHHLPVNNTTDCTLAGGTVIPAVQANWYGSAIQATGLFGIPADAKGIRLRVNATAYPTAAAAVRLTLKFSDSTTYTPTAGTAHPEASIVGWTNAGGTPIEILGTNVELDIPLNASGEFYVYTLAVSNVTLASSPLTMVPVGYWMGD